MKIHSLIILLGSFFCTLFSANMVQASDPIASKRQQIMAMKAMMIQNQVPVAAAQKKQNQLKPTKVASLTPPKPNQTQPQPQPQNKKIDLSSFAIRPMQAWRDELKVPSTSNDGIEILPHPNSQ
jgi:hypothetical protein